MKDMYRREKMETEKPKLGHIGHRQRIKERYLENGVGAIGDMELLELVLTYAIPRRDVYSIAGKLIKAFGSFDGVITAREEAIRGCVKLSDHTVILLRLIGDIVNSRQKAPRYRREKLKSVLAAVEYCHDILPREGEEAVYELLLDDEDFVTGILNISSGSGDQAPLPLQTILDNAKSNGISRVIIAHNHPSGQSAPSSADIVATDKLSRMLAAHGVTLAEHIVVGSTECTALLHHQKISVAGRSLTPWTEE